MAHRTGQATLSAVKPRVMALLRLAALLAAWGLAPTARAAAPAPGAGPAAVSIPAGRTTNVQAALPVGAPVERAVDPGGGGELYGQAVTADRDERWAEAASLYQQAIAEWASVQHHSPTPSMERAIHKANRERERSQILAGM